MYRFVHVYVYAICVCMYLCMYGWMYVCMDVCMCTYLYQVSFWKLNHMGYVEPLRKAPCLNWSMSHLDRSGAKPSPQSPNPAPQHLKSLRPCLQQLEYRLPPLVRAWRLHVPEARE